jgi:hypothetical protein
VPISKDQARVIAQAFLELSHVLGSYRFANWVHLTTAQRRQIEDSEWDLLNYSNCFVTTAVGIALTDMQRDLKTIADATKKAKKVVARIADVRDILKMAAALVVLGGAIASRNPLAIVAAADDALKAVIAAGREDHEA